MQLKHLSFMPFPRRAVSKIIPSAILCLSTAMLLTGCFFRSRDITVTEANIFQREKYFDEALIGSSGLFFDTENFMLGKLLQENLKADPLGNLKKIEEYYTISRDPKYLLLAADLCRWHADMSDAEMAVRYRITALFYFRTALSVLYTQQAKQAGSTSPLPAYAWTVIYDSCCNGIFQYLKERNLLDCGDFFLTDIFERRCKINKPVYFLSVPREAITDFSLCASYAISSLRLKNRRLGVGSPLVAKVREQQFCQSLRTPTGMTIPVTVLVRLDELKTNELSLHLEFQDAGLRETMSAYADMPKDGRNWPLALDFSTPLACFLNALPDQNLISTMLNADKMDKTSGLYMIEPYNPEKIPVVFVHGLMSSPNTWMRMLNMLKSEPEIRKHYQFWFYLYSSGAPVVYTAARLYRNLQAAQKEFCTTPAATENFNRMVVIGHSMGGMISRFLLQKNPYGPAEIVTGRSWEDMKREMPPEDLAFAQRYIFPALPFIRRVIFMAVPHKGAKMAQSPIAALGVRLTKLPQAKLEAKRAKEFFKKYSKKEIDFSKQQNEFFTGIDNLAPDSVFVSFSSRSTIPDGVPYHSIIGNREAENRPGGSDGIVAYDSSHLDGAASELVVKSGHSVHENPAAMREVQRILTLHLQENLKKNRPDKLQK